MKYGLSYILFLLLFLCDRLTKWVAIVHFQTSYVATSFLSFGLQFNRGISWGMLHSESTVLFGIVTIFTIIVTILVFFHALLYLRQDRAIDAHAMIIAGAVSNIIDRFMHGGVIDFICVNIFGWSFPVFNIADIAIVSGVGLLFLQELYES